MCSPARRRPAAAAHLRGAAGPPRPLLHLARHRRTPSHGRLVPPPRRSSPALSFKEFLGELRATYRRVTDGRRRVRVELGDTSPAEEAAAASPGDVADTRAQLEQALGALAAARARLTHSSNELTHSSNEWNVHLAPIREAIGVEPSVSRRRQADGLARHFGGGRSP